MKITKIQYNVKIQESYNKHKIQNKITLEYCLNNEKI